MIVAICGAVAAWLMIYGLNVFQHPFSHRLLPPFVVAIFLLGTIFGQVSQCLGNYLIAHKQNPMLAMAVVSSVTNAALVWLLGSHFGPIGAGAANLAVIACLVVPWHLSLWQKCRTKWHSSSA
jgi:O-antigen/teichoic acid export membrane protein